MKPPPRYIYISRVYTFTRTYARSAEDTPGVYIYIPTYWGLRFGGTPSTRLAIIQFIGLSKAPVHAVFPDRSLSLPLFLSFAPFRSFPFRFLSRRAYALSLFFSLSRIYYPSASASLPLSSRYNCLLSLVLSNRSSSPIFRLRSARCYPSFATASSLRGGERLGAIRCDNCP